MSVFGITLPAKRLLSRVFRSMEELPADGDHRQVNEALALVVARCVARGHAAEIELRSLQRFDKTRAAELAAGCFQRQCQRLGSEKPFQTAVAELGVRLELARGILVFARYLMLALPGAGHDLGKNHPLRQRAQSFGELR